MLISLCVWRGVGEGEAIKQLSGVNYFFCPLWGAVIELSSSDMNSCDHLLSQLIKPITFYVFRYIV